MSVTGRDRIIMKYIVKKESKLYDYLRLNINSVIGSLKERIDIAKEGADLKIGFNPKFLIDALRVIDDEEVIKSIILDLLKCSSKLSLVTNVPKSSG